MKIPSRYTKCHRAMCTCGHDRWYCWVDTRTMMTFKPCKVCRGTSVESVMAFAPREYAKAASIMGHPGFAKVKVR